MKIWLEHFKSEWDRSVFLMNSDLESSRDSGMRLRLKLYEDVTGKADAELLVPIHNTEVLLHVRAALRHISENP